MNKKLLLAAVVVLVVGGAGYFALQLERAPEVPEIATTPQPATPPPPAGPEIRYPIEAGTAAASLPSLDASDGAIGEAIGQLLGMKALPDYFYPDQMVRRFVATVDNLPRERTSSRMMPVKRVDGVFKVMGSNSSLAIDPANATRYRFYVNVMERLDVGQLVSVYVHFYPLFQQAYQELGYPKGYFNDRLIEAIDDMLAAPDLSVPVSLVQPNVLYTYADPELESRSAGQKIMMRMGSANADRVKAVLRSIREEVVRRASPVAKAAP